MSLTILVAHPSPDLYGSDLQLLESVTALRARGWGVVVCLPDEGPLTGSLRDLGAQVQIVDVPVIRRSVLKPWGLLRLAMTLPLALARMVTAIKKSDAAAVYVNTVTIPWWLLAARLARRPVLCHVHEAEDASTIERLALYTPNWLATAVVANSQCAADVVVRSGRRVAARTTVVLNGVPESASTGVDSRPGAITYVGRLSPRKGVDVALEAVGLLRAQGRQVSLTLCGDAYAGYEWFEAELRERAGQSDLAGSVTFMGYVSPTRPFLDQAQIVLVPSLREPFGNTAVEALLAQRPLVASNVGGLTEIVKNELTGLLVEPGDAVGLAEAIGRLLDNPEFAATLARRGAAESHARFGVGRYRREIGNAVSRLIGVTDMPDEIHIDLRDSTEKVIDLRLPTPATQALAQPKADA